MSTSEARGFDKVFLLHMFCTLYGHFSRIQYMNPMKIDKCERKIDKGVSLDFNLRSLRKEHGLNDVRVRKPRK